MLPGSSYRQVMAILLLHRSSGVITLEPGSTEEYASDHEFSVMPAVLDGDECVKLLRDGDWVATAQPASPLCPPIRQPRRRGLR
jgi:hypothetical protein